MVRVRDAASRVGLAQQRLEHGELLFGFAQIALQRQRAFAGRAAAGHGGVVEALALGREEEALGVARRQLLRLSGVFDQVAVLQLGQDPLERPAESVQNLDGVLERRDAVAADMSLPSS